VIKLPKTVVRDNETLDDAMKRFKRQVNKAGTIQDYKKHDFFLKKGLKRKEKAKAAKRKH
jgi:small subunit ribosomal protein S21